MLHQNMNCMKKQSAKNILLNHIHYRMFAFYLD